MIKLTPQQFVEMWTPNKSTTYLASKLSKQSFDFVTQTAEYLKARFESSFEHKSFCGDGPAWKPRSSSRHKHPLMDESGQLKGSFKIEHGRWAVGRISKIGTRGNSRANFKSSTTSHIFTTEKASAIPSSTRGRPRVNSYAALHNSPEAVGGKLPKRQFMGHHDGALSRVNAIYLPKIFDGMPFK